MDVHTPQKYGTTQFGLSVALSVAATILLYKNADKYRWGTDLFDPKVLFAAYMGGVLGGAAIHRLSGEKAFGQSETGRKSVRNIGLLLGIVNLAAVGAFGSLEALRVPHITTGLYLGFLTNYMVNNEVWVTS